MKPQGEGDFVEVAPAREPLRVSFDPPAPTEAQEVRPLRMAMTWIFLLVGLSLAWSSCHDEERPRSAPSSRGATTL